MVAPPLSSSLFLCLSKPVVLWAVLGSAVSCMDRESSFIESHRDMSATSVPREAKAYVGVRGMTAEMYARFSSISVPSEGSGSSGPDNFSFQERKRRKRLLVRLI